MRFATWELVAGTFVLAFATGFLVWYNHELVLAEREPPLRTNRSAA